MPVVDAACKLGGAEPLRRPENREVHCVPLSRRDADTRNRCGHTTPKEAPPMAEVQYKDASRIYPGNPVPSVNKLNLDIDSKSHPAWTGGSQQLLDRGGRVSRFQKKFSGFLKKD